MRLIFHGFILIWERRNVDHEMRNDKPWDMGRVNLEVDYLGYSPQ